MEMNRICCYLCLLGLLGIGFTVETARRLRYMVNFHGFDCINSWSIIKNWSCVIAENGNINTELTLLEPMPVVWINCKLIVLRPPQKTEMIIFNTTLDICKLLSNGSTANKIVTSIYQTMLKATNLVPQCPIRRVSTLDVEVVCCIEAHSSSIGPTVLP
ncbi:PREDICTED: uncharacterized protein LOC108616953 [Drosophila arizonae]|uniref:Uncharacterized protein LOC108616953 n=1 Tax=Drosophila arizonae TaxID=7263 RepID=A0ABM1PL94_DROAR|nr:PREDICTED: uncharacterized protein LOC108616953 [Drosophila arizonae]